MITWMYLKTASRINMALRPLGLVLWATFEGDPPERPYRVVRLHLLPRGSIGL